MSLLKSLTGLAKATVQLAKEDKEFRKEAAIAVATFPIFTAQVTISAIDVAVGATKNVARAAGKIDDMYKDRFEVKSKFDTYVDKQMRNNEAMSENVKVAEELLKTMSL